MFQPARRHSIGVRRVGPLITPDMLPGDDGGNINGPSLIRVPDWLPDRLGRYYLYFAHHRSSYIRLAYADAIEGPYRVHQPGTLRLEDSPGSLDHVASPDVHVDEQNRQIVMYYHSPSARAGRQMSFCATSTDGLHFSPRGADLGIFYFRVFAHAGVLYAIAKGGLVYRSIDGGRSFERGPCLLPVLFNNPGFNRRGSLRHSAVRAAKGWLELFYTRIGDAPERILLAHIDLERPWSQWRIRGRPIEVLRPELDWEGAGLPLNRSRSGAAKTAENALRDPAIYEEDGLVFLLYSVRGEGGIALAELSGML